MYIQVMKSKIHRVTVTDANLNYIGSITIDQDLMDAAGIIEGERVYIVDVNNGERLDTYTIAGLCHRHSRGRPRVQTSNRLPRHGNQPPHQEEITSFNYPAPPCGVYNAIIKTSITICLKIYQRNLNDHSKS